MARFLTGRIKENISENVYKLINQEYNEILGSLKFRAHASYIRMKEMKNVTSNPV